MSAAAGSPNSPDARARAWSRWVPIRPLRPRHRGKVLAHLLSLGEDDRYMRFGYCATDPQITQYVAGLRF